MIWICKWGRLKAYLRLREVKSTIITWSAYASRIKADKTSICSHIKRPDSGFELQNSTFCKVLVMEIIDALRALFLSGVRILIIPSGLKWIKFIGMTTTGLLWLWLIHSGYADNFHLILLKHFSIICILLFILQNIAYCIITLLVLVWLHSFHNKGRNCDKSV